MGGGCVKALGEWAADDLLQDPGDAGYMDAACNPNFGRTTASAAPVVAGRDSTRLEQPHLALLVFEQFGRHVVKRDEFLSTQQLAFKGDHTIGKVSAALQQSQASSTCSASAACSASSWVASRTSTFVSSVNAPCNRAVVTRGPKQALECCHLGALFEGCCR